MNYVAGPTGKNMGQAAGRHELLQIGDVIRSGCFPLPRVATQARACRGHPRFGRRGLLVLEAQRWAGLDAAWPGSPQAQ